MRIGITGVGTVWPLADVQSIFEQQSILQTQAVGEYQVPVGRLCRSDEQAVTEVLKQYPKVDRAVAMAILASRRAVESAGLDTPASRQDLGINVGSSRGATEAFERYHADFLAGQRLSPYASPVTTLGNLSTWVAYDLQAAGPIFCHAVTCTTAGYAIANGIAWLKARMAQRFLVGGAEAPITPFTVAQLLALKTHATPAKPTQPFAPESGGLSLSEGAVMVVLEPIESSLKSKQDIVEIIGIGWANERFPNPAALTSEAWALQQAMRLAITQSNQPVDYILAHAPGTLQGDCAELNAIEQVFDVPIPVFSIKGIVGHSLGAALGFSLVYAMAVLGKQYVQVPIHRNFPTHNKAIRTVMINAMGFGGSAISVIIKKLDL